MEKMVTMNMDDQSMTLPKCSWLFCWFACFNLCNVRKHVFCIQLSLKTYTTHLTWRERDVWWCFDFQQLHELCTTAGEHDEFQEAQTFWMIQLMHIKAVNTRREWVDPLACDVVDCCLWFVCYNLFTVRKHFLHIQLSHKTSQGLSPVFAATLIHHHHHPSLTWFGDVIYHTAHGGARLVNMHVANA